MTPDRDQGRRTVQAFFDALRREWLKRNTDTDEPCPVPPWELIPPPDQTIFARCMTTAIAVVDRAREE